MAEPFQHQPALQGLAYFIDQALPQTQCTRCGYPDCASYARAIAQENAPINQCPPGGQEGVERLAQLTQRAAEPLNPQFGFEGPLTVARIDENWCIGCTLCIKACPTDAIVGANKFMHTVMPEHCTGCELCIPVCPVDCIELDAVSGAATGWQAWSPEQAAHARERYGLHQARQNMLPPHKRMPVRTVAQAETTPSAAALSAADPKKAAIAAALAKARALRGQN